MSNVPTDAAHPLADIIQALDDVALALDWIGEERRAAALKAGRLPEPKPATPEVRMAAYLDLVEDNDRMELELLRQASTK